MREKLKTVFDRIIEHADDEDIEVYAAEFDRLLNSLAMDDFFGTECQSDPRGDGREGDWSILGEIEE